tara:strand:+ start:541 stop:1170 length:630 start_codon:yes stop_codon:yes gene_type:complete
MIAPDEADRFEIAAPEIALDGAYLLGQLADLLVPVLRLQNDEPDARRLIEKPVREFLQWPASDDALVLLVKADVDLGVNAQVGLGGQTAALGEFVQRIHRVPGRIERSGRTNQLRQLHAKEIDVTQALEINVGHESPVAVPGADKTIAFQSLKNTAQRCAAHAEFHRQVPFPEGGTWSIVKKTDPLAQGLVYLLGLWPFFVHTVSPGTR